MSDVRMNGLRVLERLLWWCELGLIYAAVLAAFLMMCLTSADAIARYALNSPILGAYEITEKYLMVAAIFLGMSFAYRGGVFIRVTFLVDRLSGNLKLAADYFAYFVSLVFAAVLLAATTQQALRALADDTNLSALPIPVGPAYCLIPIGLFAMSLLMVLDLPRVRAGRAFLFVSEAPAA
jgi:TRAP-type C4-dicarboxylate transport system permease small subunit